MRADNRLKRALCVLLPVLLILVLTLQSSEGTSELSWSVVQLLGRVLWSFGINIYNINTPFGNYFALVRKLAHIPEYFILGFSVRLAFEGRKSGGLKSLAACAAVSLADQCTKAFVPGREFDWTDLPLDAAGYALGILAMSLILRKRHRQKEKNTDQ